MHYQKILMYIFVFKVELNGPAQLELPAGAKTFFKKCIGLSLLIEQRYFTEQLGNYLKYSFLYGLRNQLGAFLEKLLLKI